jgi:capsular exopolysaccharide synthesis family protein
VQAKLLESRNRLQEFRRSSGLSGTPGPSLPAQQLAQLNTQLVDARARMAEARARFEQVQQLLENPGRIETAAAVLDSDLIEQLRVQEIRLNRKVAELETQYRDSHPKMANARAELRDLQDRIQAEVSKIAENLRNEYDVAQVRVRNLEAEVAELQAEIEDLNDAEVKLQALQSEVDANKELYQTLLQRLKETDVQEDSVQEPDARIINMAQPPGGPFYPNKKIFVAMAFIVSAGLAVSLAFLVEYLDAGYRSLSQMETQTGFPTFGMIPAVKLRRHQRPHGTLALRQGSVFAESIRTLRTGLALTPGGNPPRLIMMTSSVPEEGKTSTTLSLAAQTVQTGRRCLVIDCDLRAANLATYLGYPDRLGLSDFLAGNARLEEILETDPESGVHFIAAGSRVAHPDELLGSSRMENLIQALVREYEMVILDTPPVLAVSDALLLARRAEATIYLVRWGKTRRELVQRGLKQLVGAGAPMIGLALTYVDLRKQAAYEYADSAPYYGKAYRKYYGAG